MLTTGKRSGYGLGELEAVERGEGATETVAGTVTSDEDEEFVHYTPPTASRQMPDGGDTATTRSGSLSIVRVIDNTESCTMM